MSIIEMIDLINEQEYTVKDMAKKLRMSHATLSKKFKEEGFVYCNKKKKYLKQSDLVLNEVAGTKEEVESIGESNFAIENTSDIASEDASNIQSNDTSNNEIEISAIDEILDSIGEEKPKFVPLNTYLRQDIHEALNKFVDGKPRGAKQELINKLLEIAMKRKGYL